MLPWKNVYNIRSKKRDNYIYGLIIVVQNKQRDYNRETPGKIYIPTLMEIVRYEYLYLSSVFSKCLVVIIFYSNNAERKSSC